MKAITINVSDPIYSDFVRYSKKIHRPASEIIRSAMEEFHARQIARSTSLRQRRRPASVGGPVLPLSAQDDLMGEMMDHDVRD